MKNITLVVVLAQETHETAGRVGFQGQDNHECDIFHSKNIRVSFFVYHMGPTSEKQALFDNFSAQRTECVNDRIAAIMHCEIVIPLHSKSSSGL